MAAMIDAALLCVRVARNDLEQRSRSRGGEGVKLLRDAMKGREGFVLMLVMTMLDAAGVAVCPDSATCSVSCAMNVQRCANIFCISYFCDD